MLIDVTDKKLTFEFKNFSSRTLHDFEISVDTEKDFFSLREKIVNYLSSNVPQTSLVKVVLTGERRPDMDIDIDALTYKLNEIFFYAKVKDKTTLKINVEDFNEDKSVRGEFVRLVMSSDLTKEMKDAVLLLGLNSLKGE